MSENRKIVVIADDFTGAAEIGGIGLRHGLKVAIETEPINKNGIDLLVIATDTRSMDRKKAARHIKLVTKEVLKLKPLLVYKKIDSVLRGHIAVELEAQLKAMNFKRSIIIAANPVFNRIIKDGNYYIDDIPLNETCFASDFQYPIKSNNVLNILSTGNELPIYNLKPEDKLPEKGLIMGDVENLEQLKQWTLQKSEDILFAGASGFFNSLLSSLDISNPGQSRKIKPFGEKVLFVLGSAYPKDTDLLKNMIENGHYHSNMPTEMYLSKNYPRELFDHWCNEILDAFYSNNKVIISSLHHSSEEEGIRDRIKTIIASLVKRLASEIAIDEILIEGGSTTSEILNQLEIKRLTPIQELDTGVIRMQVDKLPDMCITTKPGSYNWPENVWLNKEIKRFYSEQKEKMSANE